MTTSRIGRKPVKIPSGVELKVQGAMLTAKGPKGNLQMDVHPFVAIKVEGDTAKIHLDLEAKKNLTGPLKKLYASVAGTMRAKLNNLVYGVSHGFEEKLALVGVGYRAQAKGKVVGLSLGYSHPTDYKLPEGVTVETPTPTEIIIKGANKDLVGQVAAEIREIRGPEPYKGKGVRYANEKIELKETKKK